ncbi:MAG TPA: FAD-dependent oxidoreductase, partial [candidate division Zixibacteria bacterium]|nr:FAD-dependent oxidoreductase [candidate division Zixibacteria bacterium]
VDGIFIELGLIPNSDPLKGLAKLDDEGRVVVDKLNRTSCSGLFAAGDVTDAYAEQVLIAVGEGAKATLSAYEYLLPNL